MNEQGVAGRRVNRAAHVEEAWASGMLLGPAFLWPECFPMFIELLLCN